MKEVVQIESFSGRRSSKMIFLIRHFKERKLKALLIFRNCYLWRVI